MLSRRIALVPDLNAGSESPAQQAFPALLRALDEAVARFSLPVETVSVPPGSRPEAVLHECQGALLGATVPSQPWLRAAGANVCLAAALPLPGAPRPALVVWPFEETQRLRAGRGGPGEAWIETACLSRPGVEAAARVALTLAQERGEQLPGFAWSGWGELEEQAMRVAREVSEGQIPTFALEELERFWQAGRAGAVASPVFLALGRTALPLARWRGAQGWCAWVDRGPAIAQASTAAGAKLTLPLLLDRLGFASEAAELEREIPSSGEPHHV